MKALAFSVSFLLAFLLFAVQPMATKMVLPTLGGTPAVWNTAMLTFQLLLLAGYAYAHYLAKLAPRTQWRLHGLLLAGSFLFLPLSITLQSNAALLAHPIPHLIAALLLQVGLPFFMLSATAPLLQSWVARSGHPLSQTPYVLYSASNLGSMLGLMGYVALIEPALTLHQQSIFWSALFVAGTGMLMMAGLKFNSPLQGGSKRGVGSVAASRDPHLTSPLQGEELSRRAILLWIWLSFLPSALSLGVTTYITTDIAAVPLLWVIPLALYLLSFVDAFRVRPLLVPLAMRAAPMLGMLALLAYGSQAHRYSQVFIAQLVIFAFLALALHGWLARFKPAPRYLTAFYFSLSVGGALGGLLNAVIAPLIFTETLEYPICLLLTAVTAFVLWQRHRGTFKMSAHARIFAQVLGSVMVNTLVFYFLFGLALGDFTIDQIAVVPKTLLTAASFAALAAVFVFRTWTHAFYAALVLSSLLLALQLGGAQNEQVRFKGRNFFGVERVYDAGPARYMMHNTTLHGVQPLEDRVPTTTSYYRALTSSFAILDTFRTRPLAAIGLGTGTVQCHASAGQRIDFFEINPMVVQLASDPMMFRYLSDCPGEHKIFLGDGRIELARQPDASYGGIILDAFSSDAIPTHLLTREALAIYLGKLGPHGVLLIHTTNRHLDLWPLIAAQARSLGLVAYGKFFPSNGEDPFVYNSYWVVLARDPIDVALLVNQDGGWKQLEAASGTRAWSDDYVNILPYLKILKRD